MVKAELIQRSPLRILEKSIHGGLGKGNIGAIAAPKGVGKTAVLVHLATDKLLQGQHVIHISFSEKTDHIMAWYEDIFGEISRLRDLENAMDVHNEVVKNRVIMNFVQKDVEMDTVISRVRSMIQDGDFAADTLVVDGYNFDHSTSEEIAKLKKFLGEDNLSVWFSVTVPPGVDYDPTAVPAVLGEHIDTVDVLFTLDNSGDHVCLSLLKDHDHKHPEDPKLMLDSRSLLIAKEEK